MALNKREKSFCILEYARTSSIVTAQQRFRAKFNKEHWPPRSPDLTPCDIFFMGICKGR